MNQAQPLSPALESLEREFRLVIRSREGVELARQAAHQVTGDWSEPRASGVLAEAIAGWLGDDVVTPLAFYAGNEVAEVFARIGNRYLTFQGVKGPEEMMEWCSERHRIGIAASRFGEFDRRHPGSRVMAGDEKCDDAAMRLASMLYDAIDPDIARVVLGV